MFYGMPIHIIRDVAITVRSFYKRIRDFIRYRQATKDMNTRYPDASAEEIQREDVCIICREVMYASRRPHGAPGTQSSQNHLGANNHDRNRESNSYGAGVAGDERFRPKKLPCGHILHCACLRSWLERQQNCPTCRAAVIVSVPHVPRSQSENTMHHMRAQEPQAPNNDQPRGGAPQRNFGRNTFNFGPFRLSFGVRQGFVGDVNNANAANLRIPARASVEFQQARDSSERIQGLSVHEQLSAISSSNIQSQLLQLEQQLLREIQSLGTHATQLFLIRALEAELGRLRLEMNHENSTSVERLNLPQPFAMNPLQRSQLRVSTQFSASNYEPQNITASHQGLTRLTIPPGWNAFLLRRIEINEETASTVSSLPMFNIATSRNSATHPNVEPTFQSSMVSSQTVEHQARLSEGETDIEKRSKDLSTSTNFSGMSHVCSESPDAGIQIIQSWN